jgi:hypothetical protein
MASPRTWWVGRSGNVVSEVQPVAYRFAWYEIPYWLGRCQSPTRGPVFENGQALRLRAELGPGRPARDRVGLVGRGIDPFRGLCEKFLEPGG